MAASKPKSRSVNDIFEIDSQQIGEGAFGVVYRGKNKLTGQSVALKTFKKGSQGEPISQTVYREISNRDNRCARIDILSFDESKLLRELNHENIVKLEDIFVDTSSKELIIAFEYAEYDLLEIIKAHSPSSSMLNQPVTILHEGTVRSLLWQLLNGINYLHSNWVIHRDLKPGNVLVMGAGKDCGTVKIADLGLARIFQAPLKPLSDNGVVVTIWYRAPEILLGSKHYTKAIDMWALGCIFAELMIRSPLFPGIEKKSPSGELQLNQLQKIAGWAGKLTPEIWPDCVKLPHWNAIQNLVPEDAPVGYAKHRQTITTHYGESALDLLNEMLNYNPITRISAKDALQHPYFASSRHKPAQNAFYYQQGWESMYPLRGQQKKTN